MYKTAERAEKTMISASILVWEPASVLSLMFFPSPVLSGSGFKGRWNSPSSQPGHIPSSPDGLRETCQVYNRNDGKHGVGGPARIQRGWIACFGWQNPCREDVCFVVSVRPTGLIHRLALERCYHMAMRLKQANRYPRYSYRRVASLF